MFKLIDLKNKIKKYGLQLILIFVMIVSACAPTKKAAYLSRQEGTEIERKPDQAFYILDSIDNLIRPGDELYISVTSSDEGPTNFNRQGLDRNYNTDLISYSVDEEGNVKLPYIGKIKVSDYTLQEAEDTIEEALSQFLFYPSVSIKFINNRVTLLGEVRNPGVYTFNYKTINIYQAIGYASDLTEFGNRKNVLLVRQEGNEITKKYLDLTRDEMLTSEWFQIKSNDVIYVEPLSRKQWGIQTFPYNLLISLVSTTLVILSFINAN
jgi:polysaccharide biosynthesis/export protein